MCRRLAFTVVLACAILSIPPYAATVSWQNTTQNAQWVDKGTITTTDWDNDNTNAITVDEKTTYQEFFGYGGCFNEVGWKCLMKLSQSTRDSIMTLLFDSVSGCNFSVCRVPIGANDYAIQPYTLDETSGDYTMTNFSIAHDNQYLIPYMKAATAVRPSLKIWGSPWTAPTWMKDSKTFNNGSIVENSQNFSALALYFAKAINAYQQAGLHYFAIMPANEPNWKVSMGYPVTGWSAAQLQDFIKNYLGPEFRNDDVPGEIYMGTILNDQDVNGSAMTAGVFSDSTAYSYCTGGGFQYAMPAKFSTNYPDKCSFETETPCGTVSGFNNSTDFWNYAINNDGTMNTFFSAGVSVYSQWNIVLDTSGNNIANWRQYAMVMIDTVGKEVTFTPQFYQVRHYSYVKPGAYRVSASSSNGTMNILAFRNLDGENVLIVTNKGGDLAVPINFNGQKIKPTIPGSSFNTFRIAGTPISPVSPYSKVEAEKFSLQSGILIRPCSDGGSCVTLIENNDWTCYHNVDFGSGANNFEARVSGIGGGSIEVHLDSANGPAAGTCTVPASSAWSTVSCPVAGVSGNHALYLKFKGTATGKLFDLNWFDFVAGASSIPVKTTKGECGYSIKLLSNGGKTQTLRLDFAQSAVRRNVKVSLFDLTGRLVSTPFAGPLSSSYLSLPLNEAGTGRGVYMVKVSLDNTILITNSLIFNN